MPFESTPSVDTVIEAAEFAALEYPYKQFSIVMFSPDSGNTRFQTLERANIIRWCRSGYYPLGLFGWYDKDQVQLQPVAHIFPWLQEDQLANRIFAMICEAETDRIKNLYEHRNLN